MGAPRFKQKKKKAKSHCGGGSQTMVHMPPRISPQPETAEFKPEKNIAKDFVLGAVALLAEYLALKYGHDWLAWVAGALFWCAVYDYTKSRRFRPLHA